MTKNDNVKWGFFLGIGGACIGLVVGLWAPFVLQLSNQTNFLVLSGITIFVSILLLSLTGFFLFKMPGILKSISFLVFFSWLQLLNGMTYFLKEFDEFGVVEKIEPYLSYDIFTLMPIFFALGFLPFIFLTIKRSYINIFVRERVLKNGVRSMAIITNVERSNMRINKRTLYDIELQITIPQFGTYMKKISTPISLLEIDKYRIGAAVEVMVSPTNKNTVFVV